MKTDGSIRQLTEKREHEILHPAAMRSAETAGRRLLEEPCSVRTGFWKRSRSDLAQQTPETARPQTQVFLNPEGDHYRTRMTHTLEVAQIARTIARALRLNEDLTEAIALGHDLGHTPFGHAGEAVLNTLLTEGFRHAEQSLRVVDVLTRRDVDSTSPPRCEPGSSTTLKVKVPSSRVHPVGIPPSPSRWRLRWCGYRTSSPTRTTTWMTPSAERCWPWRMCLSRCWRPWAAATLTGSPISYVMFLEHTNLNREPRIRVSDTALEALSQLRDYLWENLYENPLVHGQFSKATEIVKTLWERFTQNGEEFFRDYWPKCPEAKREPLDRAAADFIAGMTDRYAIRVFQDLYLPRSWWVL